MSLLSPCLPRSDPSGMSTIYWPVQYPTASSPWYIGGTNVVAWSTGGGTGVQVFDIQLHNANKTVMTGFKPIALRVPMEKFPKSAVYGGEIEVDLDADTPTGDGFSLLFMDTYHGEVYAKSQKFSIYASEPANYQTPGESPLVPPRVSRTSVDAPRCPRRDGHGDPLGHAQPHTTVGHDPQRRGPRGHCHSRSDRRQRGQWRRRIDAASQAQVYLVAM